MLVTFLDVIAWLCRWYVYRTNLKWHLPLQIFPDFQRHRGASRSQSWRGQQPWIWNSVRSQKKRSNPFIKWFIISSLIKIAIIRHFWTSLSSFWLLEAVGSAMISPWAILAVDFSQARRRKEAELRRVKSSKCWVFHSHWMSLSIYTYQHYQAKVSMALYHPG